MVFNPACAGTDAQQRVASRHDQLPHVVAIGGGTGLPNVLRGLRPLLSTPDYGSTSSIR